VRANANFRIHESIIRECRASRMEKSMADEATHQTRASHAVKAILRENENGITASFRESKQGIRAVIHG